MRPTHKKNTLFQAAQGNAETKACKRVFFSPTQENFFPSLPFLIKLFFLRTGFVRNLTDSVSNINPSDKVCANLTEYIFGQTEGHLLIE